MRAALREYLQLLFRHWWQLLIGVVFGAIGAVMDMEVIAAPIPSWVWWGLAFGTFAFAQFMSFATLHKETAQYRKKPKPEIYLHTVFDRLYASAEQDDTMAHPTEFAINSIIEKAIAGDIKIFGSRTDPKDGIGPQEPIDSKHWKDNKITTNGIIYFGQSPHQKAKRMKTEGEGEVYYTLKLDSSQGQLCWPQEKRFKMQWPFRKEVVNGDKRGNYGGN